MKEYQYDTINKIQRKNRQEDIILEKIKYNINTGKSDGLRKTIIKKENLLLQKKEFEEAIITIDQILNKINTGKFDNIETAGETK